MDKHTREVAWWEFWDIRSGAVGGMILGCLVGTTIVLGVICLA